MRRHDAVGRDVDAGRLQVEHADGVGPVRGARRGLSDGCLGDGCLGGACLIERAARGDARRLVRRVIPERQLLPMVHAFDGMPDLRQRGDATRHS